MITINFDKAIEITKERLRAERTPLLQAQDVAFQRALEAGSDTTSIVAEKQRLRDITNFTATTLDKLKALTASVQAIETPAEVVVETPVEPTQEA